SLRPTVLHFSLLPPLGLDLSQVLGQAFGEWVAYVGVSGLVLVGLGGLQSVWQPPIRRFIWLAGAGLVLSLGMFSGPLYLALYSLVPGFDLFRVPARWLLLYAFAAAALAGFGCQALLTPTALRRQLASTWTWLAGRRWRGVIFIGLSLLGLLTLLAWKTPPLLTVLAWLGLAIITIGLIYLALRASPFARQVALTGLILLLTAELFLAARSLNYNRPTAPQAYHSLRNAVAFLLAADPPSARPGPPGRFLSLSGITYDPGDQRDLEQIYGDYLSPQALYNLIVAVKQKEVLFFNLPLVYGLPSVDGYDGGILPLHRFVTLQQLFLPPDDLSLDGRLREKLRFVPEGRLLSLLNTRWIITDKQFDVWIDDIFYDLQFPARLGPGQTIDTIDIPSFPATALGLVSHLEAAADLPAGTPVAELTVTFADGTAERFVFSAGRDTAEGNYPAHAAHSQARVGVAWPYEAQGVDYITLFRLAHRRPITRLAVTAMLPHGRFVLRGLSLIHQPTTTSRSVIMTTEGRYRQVHSGDVKIYENLAVLPRAFVVHRVEGVAGEAAAVAAMKNPHFDPAQQWVRLAQSQEQISFSVAGQPAASDRARIVSYQPERVEIAVALESPGWLILTDAAYPGWQATLDGRPVEIMPANLLFRSIAVPAGAHTVVFQFKPRSFQLGLAVSAAALALTAVGLVLLARRAV
ncbi:MAG: YfhO family protein, partial [Chloroflexota bacterium]